MDTIGGAGTPGSERSPCDRCARQHPESRPVAPGHPSAGGGERRPAAHRFVVSLPSPPPRHGRQGPSSRSLRGVTSAFGRPLHRRQGALARVPRFNRGSTRADVPDQRFCRRPSTHPSRPVATDVAGWAGSRQPSIPVEVWAAPTGFVGLEVRRVDAMKSRCLTLGTDGGAFGQSMEVRRPIDHRAHQPDRCDCPPRHTTIGRRLARSILTSPLRRRSASPPSKSTMTTTTGTFSSSRRPPPSRLKTGARRAVDGVQDRPPRRHLR